MPFENKRTGAKAAELRAYDTEDEASAKRRLQAAGWQFDAPFEYDDVKKIFETKAIDTKKERKEAFPSEAEKGD